MEGHASHANARTDVQRSASSASTKVADNAILSRGGTLKKRQSLRKGDSLKRSGSKKSIGAGNVRDSHANDEYNNILNTPIPTSGNPTEVLANRFQAWRKLLKDLVTYFREIQASYDHRSKSLLKVSNVLNNISTPSMFMSEGGLDEATRILRSYHKHSVSESTKSKDIENDVITNLSGLRGDLSQKIKEIKSLSGDFKNSVDKEKDNTRKAVSALQDALNAPDHGPAAATGKNDPFIARLAVDRQVEKQIEEENYLHRAYLNLEGSGRELESIVVGEIQKAYNAFASILKREADSAYGTIDELRTGPIAMPKDHEWDRFVEHESHVVNPDRPLRRLNHIIYPGKHDPAATEMRGGLLERKSKYLKSYSPGWYVLSPTHLHEFKSADHISTQQPIMSLYLLDQKLGSRSQADASSHKFSLKGRQAGGMHRGHSWVFRAESYDTMMAWYEDIRNLTEKTGAERTAFVRKHARSVSGGSHSAPSVSSDGLDEDEADAVPYAAQHQPRQPVLEPPPKRPDPGGRFPSDIDVNRSRGLQSPPSPSSDSSQRGTDIAELPVVAHPVVALPVVAHQVVPHEQHPQNQEVPFSRMSPSLAPERTTYTSNGNANNDMSVVEPYPNARQFDATDVAAPTAISELSASALPARHQAVSPGQHTAREDDLVRQPIEFGEEPIARPPEATNPTSIQPLYEPIAERIPTPTADTIPTNDASGSHETGHIIALPQRQHTSTSVSQLHVPGEWNPASASQQS